MINLKKTALNLILALALFSFGYFGIKYLLKGNSKPPFVSCLAHGIQEQIIVDSLLIVVDSLQVQVDSLHLAEDKINLVFIPQKVDTVFIVKKYFTTFKHSIKHRDKNLDFKLKFDLLQNKIHSPKLQYKVLKPSTTIKLERQRTKQLFAGLTTGGSKFELDQFTPELIFLTGKHGFKIGYNLLDQHRNIQLGYYFKIK